MKMKLRFCESKIDYWADRYTERQREKDRTKEQHLIDLKKRCPEPSLPHERRIARNRPLEIAQTRSPYFREHRHLHKGSYGKCLHSHRQLDEVANVNPVARYRTADCIRNPTPLRQRTVSAPRYTRALVCRAGVDGKKLVSVLARLCSVFAAILRTGTTFQCENLIGHYGSIRPTTVDRATLAKDGRLMPDVALWVAFQYACVAFSQRMQPELDFTDAGYQRVVEAFKKGRYTGASANTLVFIGIARGNSHKACGSLICDPK